MKNIATRTAAGLIACCLSIPVFSQTTLQDAATNPAVHQALLQKIERDKQEIKAYRVGHVVVGRIQLEGIDDPEFIRSQMMIFEEGFFSDAVKDLDRPIAFRRLGYYPVDAQIPDSAAPDESGAIDLGTIHMKKCAPSEFRKAVGMITVPDGADPSGVQVLLYLSGGRVNTPHNGTEPVRKHAPPIAARIDKTGGVSADGLTEGEYYVTIKGDGFVGQAMSYQVTPDMDLDLGKIKLEQPVEISIEYIVAERSAGAFDPKNKETATILGGVKWKSRRTTEWDLEFVQSGNAIQFNYSYAPCALADLGQGTLEDFIKTDVDKATLDPRRVPFISGHVYLLNHQQSLLHHAVLFRVEVQKR